MKFYQILSWFKRNLNKNFLSQRKTIAALVYGLLCSKKAGVAVIGRYMKTNTTARHNIKRVARYIGNSRINIDNALKPIQNLILKHSTKLFITIDWTKIKDNYELLKATVVCDGRGVPIFFKTYDKSKIKNKQTKIEIEFIKKIKLLIPDYIQTFILMDRGFGQKGKLLEIIEKLGFNYIVRVRERLYIKSNKYSGLLEDFNSKIGKIYDFNNALWPKRSRIKSDLKVKSRFILSQRSGYKERLTLCTNNKEIFADKIVDFYRKRMTIEETFKDIKNIDQGFRLKNVRLSCCDRYDRLLLIISYAYLFATLFGKIIELKQEHRKIMPNTVKYRSISLFRLGLYFLNKYDYSIAKILKKLPLILFGDQYDDI